MPCGPGEPSSASSICSAIGTCGATGDDFRRRKAAWTNSRRIGTRVPGRSLFDYLEGGESIDEFLNQFPSVKREAAITVLDAAYETVAADANTA